MSMLTPEKPADLAARGLDRLESWLTNAELPPAIEASIARAAT
jgi:hypothetical protein